MRDLDTAPDLAFIAVPKELVVDTVAELATIGTGGAVLHSSGFSEMQGGAERTAALVEAAGTMPIIGPNTPGFANFVDRACFMQDHFGDHEVTQGVAFISNGGAYLSDVGLNQRSVPASYLFGMGNQAIVDVIDVAAHVVDDERVTALNLYIKQMLDAARLAAVAARAHGRGLPIVAVKGGRTPIGSFGVHVRKAVTGVFSTAWEFLWGRSPAHWDKRRRRSRQPPVALPSACPAQRIVSTPTGRLPSTARSGREVDVASVTKNRASNPPA